METPEARLLDTLMGAVRAQAVKTALDLDIPARLAHGPLPADRLAQECGCDPGAMRRLLFALTASGILTEADGGAYALTETGACLRPGSRGGLREYVEFLCADALPTAAHLTSVLRGAADRGAYEAVHGQPFFAHLAGDTAASARFDAAMDVSVNGFLDGVLARPWDDVATVADVGGGTGRLLAELLTRHPHLRGVLCEQPHVLAAAGPVLGAAGVRDRCEIVPCDFFSRVPAGADVYLLVRVLHDWDDARAARLLRAVRAAARPGSRLVVGDFVLPDEADAEGAAWRAAFDLFIHLLTPGTERTARQWDRLLAAAGFRVRTVTEAGWRGSLLECVPED